MHQFGSVPICCCSLILVKLAQLIATNRRHRESMKLIITRHAKSTWDSPYLNDHDRPLAKRGKRASDAIGRWLADQEHIPRTVLCSTSKRTRQTWSRIERCIPRMYDIRFESNLYHGGAESILKALSTVDDSPVLILGHNPGIGIFASEILQTQPIHTDFWRFPTAATLVCDVPVNEWKQIKFGYGRLINFVVPRDLK